MSPYDLVDTLHVLQSWIIQVKLGGPTVLLKVMMFFLFRLYICFYDFSFLKFKLAEKLEKQAKNRYFEIIANFEY